MKTPKNGSLWSAKGNHDLFRVLHTIELDGHIWVHYRNNKDDREYSCYLESFLSRFWEIPG
jgi:hypothetical protein